MLTYEELRYHLRKFLALTGLTPKEFKALLPAFEQAYAHRYPADKTHAGTARQRQRGGGRKSTLQTVEQKLLLALVYQKTYPVQHGLRNQNQFLTTGHCTTFLDQAGDLNLPCL